MQQEEVQHASVPVEAFQQWLASQGDQELALWSVLDQWLWEYLGETRETHCVGYSYYETSQGTFSAPTWMMCFSHDLRLQFGDEGVAPASEILSVLQSTMQSAASIPQSLDRQAFRSWAATHLTEHVGWVRNANVCPLANWLQEQSGEPYVVGIGSYGPDRYGLVADLPAWADSFVGMVDSEGNEDEAVSVTGARACEILDQIGPV